MNDLDKPLTLLELNDKISEIETKSTALLKTCADKGVQPPQAMMNGLKKQYEDLVEKRDTLKK